MAATKEQILERLWGKSVSQLYQEFLNDNKDTLVAAFEQSMIYGQSRLRAADRDGEIVLELEPLALPATEEVQDG